MTAETRSEPVDVITRAVNVEALSPWSITVLRYVSSPRTRAATGSSPFSMYRKFAAWPRSDRGATGARSWRSRENVETMVGNRATMPVASSEDSESVPAVMRRASIGSTPPRTHSCNRATVAGANVRRAASWAVKVLSCRREGRSPCQSSQVVSSNVACAASSPTGKPPMTNSPRSPST